MSISIENLLEPRADQKGRLFIKGTRISVHNVAIWWKMGINADEIAYRWGLSLAGVYAALAFYFANRNKIDKEITADEAISEKLPNGWTNTVPPPGRSNDRSWGVRFPS